VEVDEDMFAHTHVISIVHSNRWVNPWFSLEQLGIFFCCRCWWWKRGFVLDDARKSIRATPD
jgi:hypothetical protein